jgi:hypothetical protein
MSDGMENKRYGNVYRTFKPIKTGIRRGLSRKKKNREDEPIQLIIHIYMAMS